MTTTETRSITVENGGTVDFRHERLRELWANLKRVMAPDSAILWSAEWVELDTLLAGAAEVAPAPVLPPAIPLSFPDDPKNVLRATVLRHFTNIRLWSIDVELHSGTVRAELWAVPGALLKPGWRVWVKPNPDPGRGGWVLHGEYNRYGDRLR